jgi:hypothetical protein
LSSYDFTDADEVREMTVGLTEARERVGRTMKVDPENRRWTATDIRWLMAHWTIFVDLLKLCEFLAADLAALDRTPRPLRLARKARDGAEYAGESTVRGAGRLLHSEAPVRILAVLVILFAYAFALGRF